MIKTKRTLATEKALRVLRESYKGGWSIGIFVVPSHFKSIEDKMQELKAELDEAMRNEKI